MNTIVPTDEVILMEQNNPGAQLADYRQQKGYTQEFVASKLHLRVRVIELLETDDYIRLPEPVFIKGYLRAYAKLLGVNPLPLVDKFNAVHLIDKKHEKALWQTRRESNKAERVVRWFTVLFAIVVLVAVGIWWQKNKDTEQLYSTQGPKKEIVVAKVNPEVRLTDLSKMQSLFSSGARLSPMENQGG